MRRVPVALFYDESRARLNRSLVAAEELNEIRGIRRQNVTVRATATLALMLLVAASATAETVMVSVRDETGITDDEYQNASRYHLTAVEDGVMEAFFDAGHIVFNLGDYERFDGSEIQRRYTVRTAAEEGGASYVVQLALEFERVNESTLRPVRVDYELWRVGGGEPVAGGSHSAPFDIGTGDGERGSRSAALGRRVARELLSAW